MVCSLVPIYFDSQIGHTIKAKYIKLWTIDSEMCSILIFRKGSGTSFSTTFSV